MSKKGKNPEEQATVLQATSPDEGGDVAQNDQALLSENLALKAENEALLLQIANLEAQLEALAATPAPASQKTGSLAALKKLQAQAADQEPFEVDGANYRLNMPELSIRGIGKRTALDILSDDEPQKALGGLTIKEWLVANRSSAITPL